MNLKKKKEQKSDLVPEDFQFDDDNNKAFPRLHQRRNIKKITDHEMKDLEEKGRKILGL